MDYAIFRTGGKQYRCKPGEILDVDVLPLVVGSVAQFGDVLAVSDDGEVTFGSPQVPGARVLAQVQAHYKDRKVLVFKYKPKTRYRRKKGHRQTYTRLLIQDIEVNLPSDLEEKPVRKPRRKISPQAEKESPPSDLEEKPVRKPRRTARPRAEQESQAPDQEGGKADGPQKSRRKQP